MASNLYIQHTAGGKYLARRTTKQGRKPTGLGKPKGVRLRQTTEARLSAVKDRLGYLYNENELIRNAVDFYLNSVYTELLNT